MSQAMSSTKVKGSPNRAKKCYEYGHRNNAGGPCGANVIRGTTGCWRHAGKKMAAAKAEGRVVTDLQLWGLDGHTDLRDPGETLLRLVTQSAARADMYGRMLGQAYEAAERLREALEHERIVETRDGTDRDAVVHTGDEGDAPYTEDPAIQAARLDLRRIFATGGVGALIGFKYDADRYGRIYPGEEGIRGLAKLEADERDRCANFAAKAVAAGLGERLVRLAEAQGAVMASVFGRVHEQLVARLGLTREQIDLARDILPGLLAAEVGQLAGQREIAGRTP